MSEFSKLVLYKVNIVWYNGNKGGVNLDNFGQKLKKLRINNKESQKELADALNTTHQSVSKWENDIHYPDLMILKKISEHYGVTIDYLLDVKHTTEHISLKIDVSFNTSGPITVWTDFEYLGSIAPLSEEYGDKNVHIPCVNRYLPTHPGAKNTVVLAVNSENKICLLGEHIGYIYPSCGPDGLIYTKTGEEIWNNPCFLFKDTYILHNKDFEFVIPEGGFVVIFPNKSRQLKEFLKFIIPENEQSIIDEYFPSLTNPYNKRHLFKDCLSSDELNDIDVFLENESIIIKKSISNNEEKISSVKKGKTNDFDELVRRITIIEQKIDQLLDCVDELQSKIDELE